MKLKKGLIQIYTGNGKGKTTAALGLALRAAGAGLKVYILQFIKGRCYSEIKVLRKIKNIEIAQCGRGCFIRKNPTKDDISCAKSGVGKAQENITSNKYGIVILDEITIALKCKLIKIKDIIKLIKLKPKRTELVLTGRYCPTKLYKYADLVTEMKEVKHPYQKGIKARRGIES